MTKSNLKNEQVKRKYYSFLKESKGYSESTISAVKKAIYRYEEFSQFEDFSKFNKDKAIDFKKWIEAKEDPRSGKQISLSTVYNYVRQLNEFFKWLAFQPGYKSRICVTDVDYLKLSKEKARQATSTKREHYPTFEQVKKVINTIQINSEIDMRDRALISFTLLSGMRDSAIASLPIGNFHTDNLLIDQNPKHGVKTKFSKTIRSYLFRFDEELVQYVLDWVKHLKTEKLFGNVDPIFPRNKVENAENAKLFISNSVEPYFWQSITSMRTIFKQRFEDAGIEYFPPHSFRHLAVNLAFEKCRNGHELKAVSQNFGHENLGTTMTVYGTIPNSDIGNIISGMSFNNSNASNNELSEFEQFKKFQEFMKNDKKGVF